MPISKASSNAVAPAAKGDLVVGTTTNDSGILAVGSANQVLTVDSSTTTGLKWAAASSTPVKHGCMIYNNTYQNNLSQNTVTAIQWNSEHFDTDAYHNTSTNNTRITIPTGLGGLYQFNACIWFTGASSTGNSIGRIYKNGALHNQFFACANGTVDATATGAWVWETVAGDYWEIFWYPANVTTLDIIHGSTESYFGCALIGA